MPLLSYMSVPDGTNEDGSTRYKRMSLTQRGLRGEPELDRTLQGLSLDDEEPESSVKNSGWGCTIS